MEESSHENQLDKRRPVISVMIPTYNCANYLRITLESVLSQDLGENLMEIEVIDDCSTKDDPSAVVKEIGKGRVRFFQHPQNVGPIPNFNACARRAKGRWVHILHGDDYVLDGFYQEVYQRIERDPPCALITTGYLNVDESGKTLSEVPTPLPADEITHDAEPFWRRTPVIFAGAVLRKSFIEEHGEFNEELIHTADWEMWARATHFGGTLAIPMIGACYRIFEGNDTSRLRRTAENLRDYLRCVRVFGSYLPGYSETYGAYMVKMAALDQKKVMQDLGENDAALAAERFFREHTEPLERIRLRVMAYLRRLRS